MVIDSLRFSPSSVLPEQTVTLDSIYVAAQTPMENVNVRYTGDDSITVIGWTPDTRTVGPGSVTIVDKVQIRATDSALGFLTLTLTGNSDSAFRTAPITINSNRTLNITSLIASKNPAFTGKSKNYVRKLLKNSGFSYNKSLRVWKMN